MTRVRRPLAAAAGLALAALVTLPTGAAAGVDPEEPRAEWELEWTVSDRQVFREETAPVTGILRSPTGTTITEIVLTATRTTTAAGCDPFEVEVHPYQDDDRVPDPSIPTIPEPDDGSVYAFSFPVRPRCNGEYLIEISEATADRDFENAAGNSEVDDTHAEFDEDDDIGAVMALRPPDVAATSVASPDGRAISLSWQPPSGYSGAAGATPSPPDFLGYVVQRSTDGGTTFSRRASLQPAVSTFTETLGPSDPAGRYAYRVLAVRYGATSSEFAFAAGGATAVARLDVAAPPTSAPPTTARTPTSGAPARPSNDAAPTVLGTVPSTTIDEGFGEIVYDDVEPGEEEAVVPPDADSLLDFASPGAGLLIPFAIAECLAVWALHLRYLARRVDAGV